MELQVSSAIDSSLVTTSGDNIIKQAMDMTESAEGLSLDSQMTQMSELQEPSVFRGTSFQHWLSTSTDICWSFSRATNGDILWPSIQQQEQIFVDSSLEQQAETYVDPTMEQQTQSFVDPSVEQAHHFTDPFQF